MTFAEIREAHSTELNFLEQLTAYESGLERFNNVGEAQDNIDAWKEDGWDDFPVRFLAKDGAQILMLLWNTFIVPDDETKKKLAHEEYLENFKKDHPDWLSFDHYYADGDPLFINPDDLSWALRQHHYDNAHCELIAKAVMAYHKNYMENL